MPLDPATIERLTCEVIADLRTVNRSNVALFDAVHDAIRALERLRDTAHTTRTGIRRG